MSPGFSEETVELAGIETLKSLGWAYLHGSVIAPESSGRSPYPARSLALGLWLPSPHGRRGPSVMMGEVAQFRASRSRRLAHLPEATFVYSRSYRTYRVPMDRALFRGWRAGCGVGGRGIG